METPSEFLSKEELEAMIGAKSSKKQVEWLASHGWKYELNAAQRPVVGRIYARLRLAGETERNGRCTGTMDAGSVEGELKCGRSSRRTGISRPG